MRYLGGKSRLAAKIVGEIRKVCPPPIHVYEPFCGGAAVTREFAEQGYTVSASDLFPGLCEMHRASCAGFRLPSGCTDEMRKAAKGKRDTLSVALRFGLGFGGNYNSGIARPPDLYAEQFNRHCERLSKVGHRIAWAECHYADVHPEVGSVVYCDPPYAGTTEYAIKNFDHTRFWAWCRDLGASGVHVFVSEFTGPDNVPVLFTLDRKVGIDNRGGRKKNQDRTEKLFYLGPVNPADVDIGGRTV